MKKIMMSVVLLSTLVNADIFLKGNKNIGFSVGAGSSYGHTYTVVGLNANYFVVNNLALGVGYRGWFGASPQMNELLLEGNYYIPFKQNIRPYIGLFTRQTFVEDFDDYQSYGGKVGLAITTSKNSYIGVAYVLEYYSSCNFDNECSNSYPEVVFGLSF